MAETAMTNIEIRDFLTVSGVDSGDYVVLSLFGGTSAKIAVGVFQGAITSGITPSIRDSVWWIGSTDTGVQAEGLTPEFRKGSLGIEYKYTSEADTEWKLLVGLEDIQFKYEDLTEEQKEEVKLKFSDLTEADIAELQQPANDMIAVLEQTNTDVQAAEEARVTEFAALKAESEAATADAQDTADHPTYVGEDNYVYKWNKQTQTYDKTSVYVRGEAFSIKKVYGSVSEMNADASTTFKEGDFCLIDTGDVENPDNARLYVRNASGGWDFLVDMSGAIGFTGKTPQMFIGTVSIGSGKSSAAVTLTSDGTDSDGNPKYSINYVIPCLAYEDLTDEQIAELQRPASDMIAQLQATDDALKAAEAERVVAEQERVDAENIRKNNEDERVANEAIRIANEDERIASEDGRKESETARKESEDTRMANEDTRKANEEERIASETGRKENETVREEGEDTRISNENTRKANEEGRIASENERKESETARKENEETRIANEDTRKANEEERMANEDGRKSSEESRASEFASLKQEAREATDSANAAAEAALNLPKIENGTWWVYDVETMQYVDTGYAVSSDYQLTKEKVEGVFTGDITTHWHSQYAGKADLPTKVSDLENDMGYLTGHQDISHLATTEALEAGLDAKVDKVDGKQLSTEDFTTALKEKLDGLENYDDAAVTAAVTALRGEFDTLVGGNASSAIESFNEIVSFLSGLEDSESLDGIIAAIEQQIAGKQDTVGDLDDIRSGAALGATAIQEIPSEYVTEDELAAKGYATASALEEGLSAKQEKNVYFNDITVSEWVEDATYGDFAYRADIPCEGVTDAMYAEVIFAMEQFTSPDYAPVCETGDGIVSVWADKNGTITIPTIIIYK